MMAFAAWQFPLSAAAFAAFGALLRTAVEHCCFFAASSQREKLTAAPEALPPLAAAMQASQAFAPVTGAGGVGLVPPPVVAVFTGSMGGSAPVEVTGGGAADCTAEGGG